MAILTKVHHAMIDGISGVDIATVLFDFGPEPQVLAPEPWTPEPEPSRMQLLTDAVREGLTNPFGELMGLARSVLSAPSNALRGLGSVVGGVRDLLGMGTPPRGPFDREVGSGRRFAMTEAPVFRFKEIKDALGGTVNDVVLTVVAGGLHELLRAAGDEPKPDATLRAMVPVSVRSDDEKMALGNRVSMIFVDLPVGPMAPEERLSRIRERTKGIKDSMMALGAESIMNIGTWAPPTLHAMAARLVSRGHWFNLVISNVPGPQVPMYIAGARLLVNYPVMPLAENVGLSVAVTSLAGTMGFGFTGDWDAIPQIHQLAGYVEESLNQLSKAAGV